MKERRAARMERLLRDAFNPLELSILDESHQHMGHAGSSPEGETHFRIRIISSAFRHSSRIEQHRQVMEALTSEFATGLHALAIETKGEPEQ